MKLEAMSDVIVLKGYKPAEKSAGGIVLPQNRQKEANADKIAEVVEIGSDIDCVKVGDKVAWSPFNAVAVNFGEQTGTLYFVKSENILATILNGD